MTNDDKNLPQHAVAVVGMSLRVPGARTLADFWRNLRDGVESLTTFAPEELRAAGVGEERLAQPGFVPSFGALEDAAGFDATLFGFTPREAQMLDPQHRLFLECAWEALEHAGRPSDAGEDVTGVYAGVGESSYLLRNLLPHDGLVDRIGAFQTGLGNDKDFLPTRVSYKLDLRGPSVSVQTGCSTSLVAVHLACQALASGECDVALAGGATVVASQDQGYTHEEGGVLSRDGHVRAFDADASGAVPASGAGVVVLKRLSDALADGDVVHAVIRGTAINNDGARKVGFTAPSVEGQADVIAEALAVAEVDAGTVSYVEAHGTGTLLGDPIEVTALNSAFAGAGKGIALGSVKTNIGHLDTAAGVVGMIKTVLALGAREIPPSLHCSTPNPRLGLDDGPFHVNTRLTPWNGDVLRAGVSSFGIGGTNAHVVLEQAPPAAAADRAGAGAQLLPLSAATPGALAATASRLADHLRAHPDVRLDDVAHTLQQGRWALPHRCTVVAADADAAVAGLVEQAAAPRRATPCAAGRETVFAFSGQGTQRVDLAAALYAREPLFRAEVDRAAELLATELGLDIRSLLHPTEAEREDARAVIDETRYAQPALFVVEYALAALWNSWGVRPSGLIGHSLGELVAACVAGVFSLEDALRLVAVRGRLMQDAPAGAMLAVPLPHAELEPLLGPDLCLAAVNGPAQCVVSGPEHAVAAFEDLLNGNGTDSKRLRTSHAFHSHLMDAAAAAFEREVAGVRLAAPRLPLVSNVTGTWITDEEATSPSYWARQLRGTVRFHDGLRTLCEDGALLLEIGPGKVLTSLARLGRDGQAAVASLPGGGASDAHAELLRAAGDAWSQGVSLEWDALHGDAQPRRVPLPTYPFERERYWIDPPLGAPSDLDGAGAEGLSVRGFRRVAPAAPWPGAARGRWIVVPDAAGILDELAGRLCAGGARVTVCAADGLDALAALPAADEAPAAIVLGTLLGDTTHRDAADALAALDRFTGTPQGAAARVVVVTSGALDVTGEEELQPWNAQSVAWAQNAPSGSRVLVDVGSAAAPGLTDRLLAELVAVPASPLVALRGGHRFLATAEPLGREVPDSGTSRHDGARYALFGTGEPAAAFEYALRAAGADVTRVGVDGPPQHASTALLLIGATITAEQAEAALDSCRALTEGTTARIEACEVHLLTGAGSRLQGLVETHVARIARGSTQAWTTYAWQDADPAALRTRAARVVGAAPGSCHVLVAPPVDHPEAAPPAAANEAAQDAPYYADEAERQIAALFTDLLGLARIEPGDNFFELGGHSLLAAQFVSQLRKTCGVELPLRVFVSDPTVRGLAGAVRTTLAQQDGDGPESLPVVQPDPAAAHLPFPLTDVQEAYLVGRTGVFELGNVGMHGYEEFDIPGLDVPRMEHAFRRLVARQGMLRAIVHPNGEQQILTDVPDYDIATQDVRGLPAHEAHAVLEQVRAAMSHQVFVPDQWPLFELRATRMDGDIGRLHLSVDGLVTDAWAYNLLMTELSHLYHRPHAELPVLELSFRDYVLAERALESTGRYRAAEGYWKQRVPELALAPELPLARDPRTIDTPRFSRTSGRLEAPEWQRVKGWASRRGITPTALLLTVYSEVLATWSKKRRFTLNLPMANRLPLHPQVERIVGDFTSLTLLEVDAVSEAPFEVRAQAVRDRLVTDIDHRLFSGVRVMREMKKARGDAAAAMPVVFTSLFANQSDDDPLGEVAYSISQTPQIWIDAQVYETEDCLVLDIDAVENLFPEGMVASMHAACLELLGWLARDEAHWARPVPSLVPAEDLASLAGYNATAGTVPPGLLHEPFFAAARRFPERPAVITSDRTLSYGELAARAEAVAAELAGQGLRPNDLVAVVMEKGWEQCAAVLGILAAGAAYLPIDPELPSERVEFLLEHGQARAVLTQARVAAAEPGRFDRAPHLLLVDELAPREESAEPLPATATTPDDLAYVIFTSGSTGLPKGVMISHRGALNTVADVNERFAVGKDDRVLALSSLSFDLSVYDVFGPLAVGGAVVVPDAAAHRDPASWLHLVRSARVTLWNSVPALMELLVEHMAATGAADTALRLVMLSGDWLPVNLPARIRQMLGDTEVVSLGGATEASIWSILFPVGEVPPHWASIPYGRPMKSQTFHVLDEALRPRPAGVPGHLYIGGVGLALGYLHDEAKTKAAFIEHPVTGERLYRTGDLGRFLPSGDIEFLGREDFQVKVQGYRIELGEIEAAMTQHPGVRAAVVVVQGEPRGAKRLVAFVVTQDGAGVPQDIADHLATKLPRYMVPTVYLPLNALPLTANGKVDRKALHIPEDAADESAPPYLAPRTPVEEAVAEIWATMLGAERVGVRDNFFALGGDSLMAMRAVVRLRQALEVEVPIRVLFDSPTLEETAQVVEDLLLADIEGLSDEEAASLMSSH
ncbi:amino acid adenylation domain-containing protein [Streptomyces xanthochromogenes]|uniref:hybrid non-ribosomal peptide synthetase/type I polyketide synthase n=1 Tax=Streptomyces xanthochromogenes TaxID=67384 RepID=UPI0038265681